MIGDHGVSDAKDSIAKCSEVSKGASYDGEYGDPSMWTFEQWTTMIINRT